MSDYLTCDCCLEGSCPKCEGDGGWEDSGKWETCPACNGLGMCQACFGKVTTPDPFAHAFLPILPNDQESWETLLFPLL